MLSEIYTLDYISRHTTIPVPQVFDHNVHPRNLLGAPYGLMEEIQGHHVRHLARIPLPYFTHVCRQIANVIPQLSKLQFPRIGMLQHREEDSEGVMQTAVFDDFHHSQAFKSATEYYTSRTRRFLAEKQSESAVDINWAALAWLYLQGIPLFTSDANDAGPFPLRRPDMNSLNILYDHKYNIMGVIDWTASQAVPWQSFVIPSNELVYREFLEQRRLYFEIFEEEERVQNPDTPLSKMTKHCNCEIVELVDNYYGWYKFVKGDALRLSRFIFGDEIEWEHVVEKYRQHLEHVKDL
jgi:hypothetical protein